VVVVQVEVVAAAEVEDRVAAAAEVAGVEVEEVAVVEVAVVVVLVGSSSGPPTQSPLVPPTQWWLGMVEPEVNSLVNSPLLQPAAATPPLALTLPWWPLAGEEALPLILPLL
jgi:hypothetical protein